MLSWENKLHLFGSAVETVLPSDFLLATEIRLADFSRQLL